MFAPRMPAREAKSTSRTAGFAIASRLVRTGNAFDTDQLCLPCASIQHRTSSARQAVTREDSFTGAGNVPASTRRQRVDLEMGTKANTCGCRRKPVAGKFAEEEMMVDMVVLSPALAPEAIQVTLDVTIMRGQGGMIVREL